MPLTYDPAADDFVYTAAGVVKRFYVERDDGEGALALLAFLRAQSRINAETAPSRPDALRADETSRMIDEFVKNGGHIIRSTYDPTHVARKSRLKPQVLQATSGEELLSLLGLNHGASAETKEG